MTNANPRTRPRPIVLERNEIGLTTSQRAMNDVWWARQCEAADAWVAKNPHLKRLRGLDPHRLPPLQEMRDLAAEVGFLSGQLPRPSGWLWEMFGALYDPVILAIEKLRQGDADGAEVALRFLEADPYCYRSGYVKAEILRHLIESNLREPHARRVRELIVSAHSWAPYGQLKLYRRLAIRVDSPDLRKKLRSMSGVQPIGQRAAKTLALLEQVNAADPDAPPMIEA